MVFDRRFTAASPRYLGFNALSKTDNHGPCPSPNTYALLTRPFLMVLDVSLGSASLSASFARDTLCQEDLQ